MLSDEELSTSPSATHPVSNKRPRLLAPHLNCSIDRSLRRNQSIDNASVNSSSASDATSGHTDEDAMHFHGHGPGPKNNSTPRTINSDEIDLMMPTPQTMPVSAKNMVDIRSEMSIKMYISAGAYTGYNDQRGLSSEAAEQHQHGTAVGACKCTNACIDKR